MRVCEHSGPIVIEVLAEGPRGLNGWVPILAIVPNGERSVQQVVDWAGGTGAKPAVGQYIGQDGFVDDINDASDLRGAVGDITPEAQAAADSAASDAIRAEQARTEAEAGAEQSTAASEESVAAKSEAVTSAAVAQMNANLSQVARDSAYGTSNTFPTVSAGLAGTASGQYFSVPKGSAADGFTVYRNNAGAADPVATTFSNTVVDRLNNAILTQFRTLDIAKKTHRWSSFDSAGNRVEQGYAIEGELHWASFIGDKAEFRRAKLGAALVYSYRTLIKGDVFFTDAAGKIISVSGGSSSIAPEVAALQAEMATARGTRLSLNDRMSVNADAYGNPISATWGLYRLRQTRMKMRRILSGIADSQLNISIIGDSTTYLPNVVNPFTLGMRSILGNAGGGYVNTLEVVSATPFAAQGEITTVLKSPADSWTRVTNTSMPDMGYQESAIAGARLTFNSQSTAAPVSACKVTYWPTADGVARYRWNDGAWTSLPLTAGTGPSGIDITGVPSTAAWKLDIEVVSGTCRVGGLYLSGTPNGVRVNKLGQNGSTAGGWAARTEAEQIQGWQLLGPQDLGIINLSTNDQINRTPAAIAASLLTLRNRFVAANPAADVLIVQPPENQNGRTTLMVDITKAVRQMCVENKIPFGDLQYVMGDTVAQYSVGSAHDWQSDLTHPNAAFGGPVWADAYIRSIAYSQ